MESGLNLLLQTMCSTSADLILVNINRSSNTSHFCRLDTVAHNTVVVVVVVVVQCRHEMYDTVDCCYPQYTSALSMSADAVEWKALVVRSSSSNTIAG